MLTWAMNGSERGEKPRRAGTGGRGDDSAEPKDPGRLRPSPGDCAAENDAPENDAPENEAPENCAAPGDCAAEKDAPRGERAAENDVGDRPRGEKSGSSGSAGEHRPCAASGCCAACARFAMLCAREAPLLSASRCARFAMLCAREAAWLRVSEAVKRRKSWISPRCISCAII